MRLTTTFQGNESAEHGTTPGNSINILDDHAHRDPLTTHQPPTATLTSEEYSPLLARATNDAVRVWNVKTGELSWPQGLQSLLGYSHSPATAKISFWQQRVHPDDRAGIATSLRDALNSDAQTWSGEYRFERADGSYIDLLERAAIVRDPKGGPRRFVGSLMDVTERKHLHDQVSRAQKMEAFGQLAGGMAHDFNNFLTTILGYSDMLLGDPKIKGPFANHVSEIRAAAGRASSLTAQLLAFSRKHPLAPRVVEANSLIANLERSLLRLLGEHIHVRCELHEEKHGAHIQVDPGELTQVILNLAVNARDAMPRGGDLVLRTALQHVTEQQMPGDGCEPLPPGDYVAISVSDTGCGMSDEAKQHLFEPFFTTKDARTGLGLATSFGIIGQSGGHIYVASTAERGTTVTVYLPHVAAPANPYKKPSSRKLPGGTETILVLEDDVSVRHLSVRVLRSLGYDVVEAANGDDAQHLITERRRRNVHLLLTDIMMPAMSGRDFAAWLARTSPETKVIFVSGYLDESLQFAQHCDHAMYFLPKPFDAEQLAMKIREALDAS